VRTAPSKVGRTALLSA